MLPLLLTHCGRNENDKIDPAIQKDILEMQEHIKIDGLQDELTGVIHKKDVYDFIGINTNGLDCLYFPYKDGKFNIEYEILSAEQKEYAEQLKAFAKSKGFHITMTSYQRKGYYKKDDNKNVIRIEANANAKKIAALAKEIQAKIFLHDDSTVYDVVPQ